MRAPEFSDWVRPSTTPCSSRGAACVMRLVSVGRTSDPIDWIEQIPFGETRNYVQRVLENAEVYRARLAGKDVPLNILADLYAPNAPRMAALTGGAAK